MSTTDVRRAEDAATAAEAVRVLHSVLVAQPDQTAIRLQLNDPEGTDHVPDGPEAIGSRELNLPRPAADLLEQILAAMASGQPVTVIPGHAELTTQQAAEVLNVSRPFVIKLLEQGEIKFRMVGTHRRLLATSVREYFERSQVQQHEAAAELTRLTEEMGLY